MPLRLAIDHVVIAVRDLDGAAADFRALGFTLTPRGHHSIGSQNHCIMFGLDYYRSFGEALAALALATDDADAAARRLPGAKAPTDLSRRVEGGVARFRLVQIENLPYVFVCQHLTPELVWRPQWRSAGKVAGVSLPMKQPFAGTPPTSNGESRRCCGFVGREKPRRRTACASSSPNACAAPAPLPARSR